MKVHQEDTAVRFVCFPYNQPKLYLFISLSLCCLCTTSSRLQIEASGSLWVGPFNDDKNGSEVRVSLILLDSK